MISLVKSKKFITELFFIGMQIIIYMHMSARMATPFEMEKSDANSYIISLSMRVGWLAAAYCKN